MDIILNRDLLAAFIIALGVTLLLGLLIIPLLRKHNVGQHIRPEGPSRHLSKVGTPAMGGVIFIAGMLVATLALGWFYTEALVICGIMLGFGLIGFLDDFIKATKERPLGLRAREKLLGQILLSGLLAALALNLLNGDTGIMVPFSDLCTGEALVIFLNPWLFAAFIVLVTVGTTNAVNLTDGLDGLAAGVTIITALAFASMASLAEHPGITLAMIALVGACFGFLFFNWHPAKVFMGDTGSLALGGALSAAAVLTGTELYLLVIGGVFVLEALSVIMQVFSFKVFKRRIFKMSPLHHHFELIGWSERQTTVTFWGLALWFAFAGLIGFI